MYFEPKRCVSVSFRNEGTTLLITDGKSAALMNDSTAEKAQLGRQIFDQMDRHSTNLQASHIGAYVQSIPESPTRHINVLCDIPGL
jgi:5-formyltetrahydrofolate cyclo-ligase